MLAQAVLIEVPGNRGWLLKVQANNLNALAESSANLLRDPRQNAVAAQQAVANLESAVRGLQNGLGQSDVAAPSSRLYANQAAEYLAAIRRTLPGSPSPVVPASAPARTVIPTSGLNQESYYAFFQSSSELARD